MAPSWLGHRDHKGKKRQFKGNNRNDVALCKRLGVETRPMAKGLTSKTGAQLSKTSQTLPQLPPRQVLGHRHLDIASRLLAPVSRLLGLMTTCFHTREVILPRLVEVIDHRLVQRLLVPLQCQDIIRLAFTDLRGDRLRGPQRVDRDEGTL